MSKIAIGDFCAHVPSGQAGVKGTYKKIGVVFRDSERGGLSVKIDTLPIPGSGWVGWCNIFEEQDKPAAPRPRPPIASNPFPEDDIPF